MSFHCLLQIIGMTASLGVGDAMVCGSAVQYILRKCANLDARGITITRRNKEELGEIVREPQEGRKPLLHRLILDLLAVIYYLSVLSSRDGVHTCSEERSVFRDCDLHDERNRRNHQKYSGLVEIKY